MSTIISFRSWSLIIRRILPLFFQTILFALTLYRSYYILKESHTLGIHSILMTFTRDGLWAYSVMLSGYPRTCIYSVDWLIVSPVISVLNVVMYYYKGSTPLEPMFFKWVSSDSITQWQSSNGRRWALSIFVFTVSSFAPLHGVWRD